MLCASPFSLYFALYILNTKVSSGGPQPKSIPPSPLPSTRNDQRRDPTHEPRTPTRRNMEYNDIDQDARRAGLATAHDLPDRHGEAESPEWRTVVCGRSRPNGYYASREHPLLFFPFAPSVLTITLSLVVDVGN
jgi:hypothetical protein